MAETKRIQLRGISRNPSDRMTDDGGVAESLNVHIDNSELAPMVEPENVSEKWGLPRNLDVDNIYIHKTPNFERLIVVANNTVCYIQDGNAVDFLTLDASEVVTDITSLGNTLVISTNSAMYYVLWKDGKYSSLGSQVPFPQIEFSSVFQELDEPTYEYTYNGATGEYWWETTLPTEDEWNADSAGGKNHSNSVILSFLNEVSELIKQSIAETNTDDYFVNRVFVRYTATLYDETKLSSMPILLSAIDPYEIALELDADQFNEVDPDSTSYPGIPLLTSTSVTIKNNSAFKIKAKLTNLQQLQPWLDIIKSIDFFVSVGTDFPFTMKSTTMYDRTGSVVDNSTETNTAIYHNYACKLKYNAPQSESADNLLSDSAQTYRVLQINLHEAEGSEALSQEFLSLEEGSIIKNYPDLTTAIEDHPLLSGDDMKHYFSSAQRHITFNNSLILLQPSSILAYTYDWLNNHQQIDANPSTTLHIATTYEATYLLKAQDGTDRMTRKAFSQGDLQSRWSAYKTYSFQTFPDSRCYKMIIKATKTTRNGNIVTSVITRYASLEMLPHPFLDCAYHYVGHKTSLWDLCTLTEMPEVPEGLSSVDDRQNYLFVSEINNPFFFPNERKYQFSSPVVGAAIATFALSQGQFGQYPLYVFTEDGIYAGAVADDGKITSFKPLSRDVCTNPESIVSIDQAVVFVGKGGVMLLRGSDIVNISPYMRREGPELTVQQESIISSTEYNGLLTAIKEKEQFMAFMKNAIPVYDYSGNRLIFLSEGESTYQYIYYFETQTWHKSSFSLKKTMPLNSYPEALVCDIGESQISVSLKGAPLVGWRDDPNMKDAHIRLWRLITSKFNGNPYFLDMSLKQAVGFLDGTYQIPTTHLGYTIMQDLLVSTIEKEVGLLCEVNNYKEKRILDWSTIYDGSTEAKPLKAVVITRPFDLGEPDVFKSITDVRIRGEFPNGSVNFILEGSNDGKTFHVLSTLRGKSWKVFRMAILANLDANDRISWIDVAYERRFTNRLR